MSCPSAPSGVEVSQESSGRCSYTPPCISPFTLNPNTSNCEYKISSVMDLCPSPSTKTAPLLCSYTPQCNSSYSLNTTSSLCVSAPTSVLTQPIPSIPSIPSFSISPPLPK